MGRISVTKIVQAPHERVFATVAKIENFRRVVPEIVGVEYVGQKREGVGTKFRETRQMGKRKATLELEVTEYVENERIRLVSDAGGTLWDTVFSVQAAAAGATELRMVMDDNAYRLLARLFNPLIRGTIRKAVERDMEAVKAYCEQSS